MSCAFDAQEPQGTGQAFCDRVSHAVDSEKREAEHLGCVSNE
jgi:hypothetical protein